LEKALAREREKYSEAFATGKQFVNAYEKLVAELLDAFRKQAAELEDYRRQERASIAASAGKKKRGKPRKLGGRAEQRELRELGQQVIKEYDSENPPAWMPPETQARFKGAKELLLNPHPKKKPTRGKPGRPRDDEKKLRLLRKVEAAKKRDGVKYDAPYLLKLSNGSGFPVSTLKYRLRRARVLQR
jgi:hypothetical protein